MIDSKHLYCFGCVVFFYTAITLSALGQPIQPPKGEAILLQLDVERSLLFDIDASLYQDSLYLPATKLFSLLNIKSAYRPEASTLEIYFPNPDKPVRLNLEKQTVSGPDQFYKWSNGKAFFDENELFLHKNLVEQIADFDIFFDYRKLLVMLFSENELPVIQFHERKEHYKQFNKNSSAPVLSPEMVLPRRHYLFNGWVADWSLSTSHSSNNFNYSYGLGIGGQLLGGDFTLRGSGSKKYGIHCGRINGRWKYPIYSSPLVKQVQVGDLSLDNTLLTNGVAFQGVKVTNRPNSTRKQFDTFSISNQLNEGWDTEFYVNQQFRDYAVGDKEQRFEFTTPLKYGSNFIQLKYYNDDGFHHQRKYMIYVPQEFLPPRKLEYTLSAGRYSYLSDQYFGQFDLKWGALSNLTFGSGMMMETSEERYKALPFLKSWFRLGNHLIAKGGHLYRRMSNGSLRMLLPNSQSVQLDIKKYHRQSIFNRINNSLLATLSTSFPVRLPFLNFSTYVSSRYTRSQSGTQFLNLYSGVSSRLPLGIGMFLKSNLKFRGIAKQRMSLYQMQSQLTLSKYLFNKILLRPTVKYNHNLDRVTDSQLKMRYRISSNSYLNFSINRDHLLDNNQFLVSFKLDLPFARSTSFLRRNPNSTTFNQTTFGSVSFNPKKKAFKTSNRNQVGKGVLTFHAFLDLNQNNHQDSGEPPVEGLTADVYRQGASRPSYENKSVIRDLIPYDRYFVKINNESLHNPLWRPISSSYTTQVLPNSHNTLTVPIVVVGEASGNVVMEDGENVELLNNLEVKFSSVNEEGSKQVKTYMGGSFYYVGLQPGTYLATLDPRQLSNHSLEAVEDSVQFTINSTREGDIVDNLLLKVRSTNEEKKAVLNEIYAVQIGAFKYKENASRHAVLTEFKTEYKVKIEYDPELKLYICRTGMLRTEEQANLVLQALRAKSYIYSDAFIVKISLD